MSLCDTCSLRPPRTWCSRHVDAGGSERRGWGCSPGRAGPEPYSDSLRRRGAIPSVRAEEEKARPQRETLEKGGGTGAARERVGEATPLGEGPAALPWRAGPGTTHAVHGEDLGPDEDKERPQLPGRALEQLQHVGEDAHGQRLRGRGREPALEGAQGEKRRDRCVPGRWPFPWRLPGSPGPLLPTPQLVWWQLSPQDTWLPGPNVLAPDPPCLLSAADLRPLKGDSCSGPHLSLSCTCPACSCVHPALRAGGRSPWPEMARQGRASCGSAWGLALGGKSSQSPLLRQE